MNIERTYQKIIDDLQQDSRALLRYSQEEVLILREAFAQELDQKNYSRLEKILCLMDHASHDHPEWEMLVLKALNQKLPAQLQVFLLNCSRKHIVQARFKRGNRLPFEFLEALKNLLYSPEPEVVEWTLRTIEETGNQGVYFLQEFDKIKPGPWKWFNAHQRAVRELITLLERRWSKFEKH
jgi:hypothetical protein